VRQLVIKVLNGPLYFSLTYLVYPEYYRLFVCCYGRVEMTS